MKGIHVRVSEQEEELLQEKAAQLGRTVSDLVRDVLFRNLEGAQDHLPASAGQLEELSSRLGFLAETVQGMADLPGKMAGLEQKIEALSDLKNAHEEFARLLENAEEEIHALSENLVRQVEILAEERGAPFGMQRSFVQVSLLAAYTLARGTFSNKPEAWEPYKDEARRRAFPEGGAT